MSGTRTKSSGSKPSRSKLARLVEDGSVVDTGPPSTTPGTASPSPWAMLASTSRTRFTMGVK